MLVGVQGPCIRGLGGDGDLQLEARKVRALDVRGARRLQLVAHEAQLCQHRIAQQLPQALRQTGNFAKTLPAAVRLRRLGNGQHALLLQARPPRFERLLPFLRALLAPLRRLRQQRRAVQPIPRGAVSRSLLTLLEGGGLRRFGDARAGGVGNHPMQLLHIHLEQVNQKPLTTSVSGVWDIVPP
eukprot:7274867-Pyramimonas_sp.AAC.1